MILICSHCGLQLFSFLLLFLLLVHVLKVPKHFVFELLPLLLVILNEGRIVSCLSVCLYSRSKFCFVGRADVLLEILPAVERSGEATFVEPQVVPCFDDLVR